MGSYSLAKKTVKLAGLRLVRRAVVVDIK